MTSSSRKNTTRTEVAEKRALDEGENQGQRCSYFGREGGGGGGKRVQIEKKKTGEYRNNRTNSRRIIPYFHLRESISPATTRLRGDLSRVRPGEMEGESKGGEKGGEKGQLHNIR